MSHEALKYCCSNPDCRHRFTVEEAKHEEIMVETSALGFRKHPMPQVSLLHIICPKCDTIATSIHVPAETM